MSSLAISPYFKSCSFNRVALSDRVCETLNENSCETRKPCALSFAASLLVAPKIAPLAVSPESITASPGVQWLLRAYIGSLRTRQLRFSQLEVMSSLPLAAATATRRMLGGDRRKCKEVHGEEALRPGLLTLA